MQWPAWRLWCEQRCSMTELGQMSVDEVHDACVVLDEWHAAGRRAQQNAARKP